MLITRQKGKYLKDHLKPFYFSQNKNTQNKPSLGNNLRIYEHHIKKQTYSYKIRFLPHQYKLAISKNVDKNITINIKAKIVSKF